VDGLNNLQFQQGPNWVSPIMQITFVVALIFAIAVALFAVQNTTPVTVNFLWLQIPEVAVSVLVLTCTFLGAAATILVGLGRDLKRTLTMRSLRQQVASQERRIHELEAQLPVNTALSGGATDAAPVPMITDTGTML
jgi:putative membrane protein